MAILLMVQVSVTFEMPLENLDEEAINRFILKKVLEYAIQHQKAIEQCRFDACMAKFKSVSICSGSSAFYTWAKVLTNRMKCE